MRILGFGVSLILFVQQRPKAYISGEENQGIISRAKWRIHFIDIRQSLARNYEQGRKIAGKLKLSWGVRY